MGTSIRLGVLLALAGLLLAGGAETSASLGTTVRVSVSSAGAEGTGDSLSPAINEDGRYIAFVSWAPNLVTGDTDACELDQPGQPPITYNCPDIFVRDRQASATERVNVSSDGVEANGQSWEPAISHDGRYVAFDSDASNLVTGDTNNFCQTDPDPELDNCSDVFVRDRDTDADGVFDESSAVSTERVSVSSSGAEGNNESYDAAISADGRFVAFTSDAFNLVPPNETNGYSDVFVRDRQAGTTERVSVDGGGGEGDGPSLQPAISGDGRYVAFYSEATDLVSNDSNGTGDIFVRDRQAGTTERASVSSAGGESNGGSYSPAMSADGRYVAFGSAGSNLVAGDTNALCDTDGDTQYDDNCPDVFVRDRQTSTTTRVSLDSAGGQADAGSFDPAISADGISVAFQSAATNLVWGDTDACGQPPNTYNCPDVFARDRDTDEDGIFDEAGAVSTTRVSVNSSGVEGNGESLDPSISGDGRFAAFESMASNLVPGGDANGSSDIFVHDQAASPVGGVAELPDVSGSSAPNHIPLAGLAAAALALLAAGVWYAGKRLRQG